MFVKDSVWFTEHIILQSKRVQILLNNKRVVDYTEPDKVLRKIGDSARVIFNGTFALQGHNPTSIVYFKNIMVKILPI